MTAARSPSQRRSALARSLTTAERADLLAGGRATAGSPALSERRLERLRSDPTREGLPPLTTLRDLDEAGLRAALGFTPSSLPVEARLLEWTDRVDQPLPAVLRAGLQYGTLRLLRIVAPIAAPAVQRVAVEAGDGPVLDGAVGGLIRRLADLAMPTVVAESQVERQRSHRPTPESLDQLADRMASIPVRVTLVDSYPVLARRVALVADHWANATLELWTRLRADVDTLADEFDAFGPVTALTLGLGDPHRRGRTVAAIMFESGLRVVYKPRELSGEQRLQTLLDRLNTEGGLEIASRRMLPRRDDRGAYGWDAWVDDDTAIDTSEVPTYFRRLGALLAVLHPLRVRDLHCSNLIASGSWPVVLDAETMLVPRLRREAGRRLDLTETVIGSGALPGSGATPDVSALGVRPGRVIASDVPSIVADGPDVRIEHRSEIFTDARSLPLVQGTRESVAGWVDEVLAGFDLGAHALDRHRRWWRELVEAASNDEIRVVVRPTRLYAELALAAVEPAVNGDALDLDAIFDHLGRWPVAGATPSLLASERRQLHDVDVPLFTCTSSGTAVTGADGTAVDGLVAEPGTEAALRRLNAFDGAAARRQRLLLETSLTAGLPRLRSHLVSKDVDPTSHARHVAALIDDLAQRGAVGATWISPGADDAILHPVGLELYDGQAGIVLFLAELGACAADQRATQLARCGARELIAQLDGADLNVGAWAGAAGISHVLTRLGSIWDDPTLDAHARTLLTESADRLDSDRTYCTVSGAAGLAIVAAERARTKADPVADDVASCARAHLVAAARIDPISGEPAWPAADHEHRLVTGVAHGLGGITWALSTDVSGSARAAAELAISATRAEQRLFTAALEHQLGGPETTSSWCHGPAGIAAVRSAVVAWTSNITPLRAVQRSFVNQLVDAALHDTNTEQDGLCHGLLGALDSIVIAGQLTAQRNWIDTARARTIAALKRATTDGWRLYGTSNTPPLGLMTGIAGIGHALLRIGSRPPPPPVLTLSLE